MNEQEFKDLGVGDIIENKALKIFYTVTGIYGDHVTAIKTAGVTNPSEWTLINKVCTRKDMIDEDTNRYPG